MSCHQVRLFHNWSLMLKMGSLVTRWLKVLELTQSPDLFSARSTHFKLRWALMSHGLSLFRVFSSDISSSSCFDRGKVEVARR